LGNFNADEFSATVPQVAPAHPVSWRGWGRDIQAERELLKLLLKEMPAFNKRYGINKLIHHKKMEQFHYR